MHLAIKLDTVSFMKTNVQAHWRDSARPVKFFIWDGKAVFPILLFFLHMKLWTLIVALLAVSFFTIINRYGFTPMVFLRWLRATVAGPRKMSIPWWMK